MTAERGIIARILREPLIQFLLLGTALFAGYSYITPDASPGTGEYEILLTPDELLQMTVYFQSRWQRPPTAEEFNQLLENKIQEKILYREAIAMGLDQDDTIVSRRMAQKMKFLAEDVAAARVPDIDELRTWYDAHSELFAMPGRISFRQVYFSPDIRGDQARTAAEAALVELAGQPIDSPLVAASGDRILLQDYFGDRSVETLAKEFGPSFAQAIRDVKPGAWRGPIESGLGWHLVFVDNLEPGREPDFFEVETEVKNAWLAQQKDIAWREAYDEMRAKYTVLLPAFPEAEVQTAPPSTASTSTDTDDDTL